ncbi:MAG: hypothetical protein ABW001_09080 [Mycobacterium sp.]
MTIHDPGNEQYREDVPTMTLAQPEPATNARHGEHSSDRTGDELHEDAEVFDPNPEGALESSSSETRPSREPSLFADDDLAGLRARWNGVQAGFVDDPRDCVQRADGLVSDVVGQLTAGFTEARSRLEQQWSRGEEASTEDLRVALTRYRDFFERLLAV